MATVATPAPEGGYTACNPETGAVVFNVKLSKAPCEIRHCLSLKFGPDDYVGA
jgi:hypothetical protein